MVQSAEGERQTYFLRQTQKVQFAEEERHTHTHTYILAAAKQSLQSAEGERNSLLAAAAYQSFNLRGPTLHSYEKSKIFPPVWRLDEILWSDPFAILQVAAAI
jgi:hypothetical protein